MNRLLSTGLIALSAASLVACGNMSQTQQDTGKGAAVGGAVGAVLGNVIGHNSGSTATGAALGAAIGAGAGYIWSNKMQEQKAAMERRPRARAWR